MNIEDVAREANVSKTTVSRVLANSNSVTEKTRLKVMDAIERMGYIPNTSAQILAGGKKKAIGVINGYAINDPFYGYMNNRIAYESEKRDYNAIFTVAPEKEIGCYKEIMVLNGKVDAFVIFGNNHITRKDCERLIQLGIPTVLFKPGFEYKGILTVDIDNELGGYQAGRYLIEKGYRNIGYMHGSFGEGELRERGFVKALSENHLQIKKDFYANREFARGYDMAEEILQYDLDAIFCETDLMAYSAAEGIIRQGRKIPEDIAVLGFDNFKFNNFQTIIELSTISQPLEDMAEYIVSSLIDKVEHNISMEESRYFTTEVVVRSTT